MCGSITPKRASRKRITEVWSKQLGIDVAALGPGRDDDHRHARAQAHRLAVIVLAGGGDRALAGGRADRRDRRRHVVEEAVVLVVVQDEHRLGPDLGVGRQRRDQPRDQIGAVRGRGAGMLAELVGRHDPGDLRQAVGGHVLGELGHQVLALGGLGVGGVGARDPGAAALVEHRVRADAAEVLEVGQAVVAVVVVLLIDPPGDARRLQPLGVGRPGQALELRRVLGRVGGVVVLLRRIVRRRSWNRRRPPARWCR